MNNWNRMFDEVVDFDGQTNFKKPFEFLTRKHGKAFLEYLKHAYEVRDELTDEEFCHLNHVPEQFLSKLKKEQNDQHSSSDN